MSEPLLVLVLLGGGGGDPATEAMMSAARTALGTEALVVADSSAQARSDADALVVADRMRARAVVRVAWGDPSKPSVRLHVHVEPLPEWADDVIAFDPRDAPAERARTTGFALATMVQRLERAREERAAVSPTTSPPETPRRAWRCDDPTGTLAHQTPILNPQKISRTPNPNSNQREEQNPT